MVNIVSSEIEWNLPQCDGRSVVRERHVDDQNVQYVYDYVAEIETDVTGRLALRAQALATDTYNGDI